MFLCDQQVKGQSTETAFTFTAECGKGSLPKERGLRGQEDRLSPWAIWQPRELNDVLRLRHSVVDLEKNNTEVPC